MLNNLIKHLPTVVKKRLVAALHPYMKTEYKYIVRQEERRLLEGKPILVTGATGAIGFATCLKLGAQGGIVGVAGRSEEKLRQTMSQLQALIPEGKFIQVILDVTNEDQIKESIKAFAASCNGLIYGLVNNAGGGERKRKAVLWELPTEVIDEVIDTNLRGSMLCAKYAIPFMLPYRAGKIVNLCSVMGLNGKEQMTSYSASKSGIIGFTKALALECGPYQICVNSVAPGMVWQRQLDRLPGDKDTVTNALHRYGYTDEVASVIAFLLSEEANYVTGQTIAVDEGRSIGLKDNEHKKLLTELCEHSARP